MKRKLYYTLLSEKDSHKISILVGPRQVGKTTILNQLHSELGGLYVDFDILENVSKFDTYEKFISSLELEGYDKSSGAIFYLFVDEFQKYSDLTTILKNVYDHHKNIKIYATGSSSIMIKNKVQESLAGRKFLHYIYPLDFEEFLQLKNISTNKLKRLISFKGDLPSKEYSSELEEFLIYGSYPEVVLSSNKEEILKSIFDTFIRKDLVDYLNVSDFLGVKKLIEYVAINNGQKINLTDVSNQLGLSRREIENYFDVLEESFILKKVRPFFTNKSKEIVKSYKLYFVDCGVRNYFLNNFNSLSLRSHLDSGFLFETFVLAELLKNSTYQIKFWQDKKKHEVDFVIDKIHKQIGLEVKFKSVLKSKDYLGVSILKKSIDDVRVLNLIKQDDAHLLPFSIINLLD